MWFSDPDQSKRSLAAGPFVTDSYAFASVLVPNYYEVNPL